MKHDELVHLLETKYGLSVNHDPVRDNGCEFNFDRKYLAKDCNCFARWFSDANNNIVWELRNKVIRNYNPDAMEANASSDDFLQDCWDENDGEIDITEEEIDLRWKQLNESYDEFVDRVSKMTHFGHFEITQTEKQKIYSAIKLYDYTVEHSNNEIVKRYIKDLMVNSPMEDIVYLYTYTIEPLRTKFSSTAFMRTINLAGDVKDVHAENEKMKNLYVSIIQWSVDYAGYVVINGEKYECDCQPIEVKDYILEHSNEFEEPDYNKIIKEYHQELMLKQIAKEFE